MNEFKTTPVLFDEVYLGLIVKDSCGYIGPIVKCKDIHNIIVKFEPQGYRFLSLDINDKTYRKLYASNDIIENCEIIKCKCGETLYVYKDIVCPRCNEINIKN